MKAFVENPTWEILDKCAKENLLIIATHLGIKVAHANSKGVVRVRLYCLCRMKSFHRMRMMKRVLWVVEYTHRCATVRGRTKGKMGTTEI